MDTIEIGKKGRHPDGYWEPFRRQMRALIEEGRGRSEIAARFNVSASAIGYAAQLLFKKPFSELVGPARSKRKQKLAEEERKQKEQQILDLYRETKEGYEALQCVYPKKLLSRFKRRYQYSAESTLGPGRPFQISLTDYIHLFACEVLRNGPYEDVNGELEALLDQERVWVVRRLDVGKPLTVDNVTLVKRHVNKTGRRE